MRESKRGEGEERDEWRTNRDEDGTAHGDRNETARECETEYEGWKTRSNERGRRSGAGGKRRETRVTGGSTG